MARGTNQGTKHKSMSYTKFGYLFIAPFVIVYCIFSLYPLLTTFWYSGANMQSTTSNFWGFSDMEIYYDEYLDLTQYIDDSEFEAQVGCKKQDYMKVRNFFVSQSAANQYSPLAENGINAILNNDEISKFVDKNSSSKELETDYDLSGKKSRFKFNIVSVSFIILLSAIHKAVLATVTAKSLISMP